MHLLFLEEFVNLGVVPNNLWVRFDHGELDWDGGQGYLPGEGNVEMRTVGRKANT